MLKLKLMLTMSWKFTPCTIVLVITNNFTFFHLVKDKMEKVHRCGNGLSARQRLATDGEVGCAAVCAVVKHLKGQLDIHAMDDYQW